MAIARTGVYVDDYLECKIHSSSKIYFDLGFLFLLVDDSLNDSRIVNSNSSRCQHFPCRASKTS